MPSGVVLTATVRFPPRVGGNVATGGAVAGGAVLSRNLTIRPGYARAVTLVVRPSTLSGNAAAGAVKAGVVLTRSRSIIPGSAKGGASAGGAVLARSPAIVPGRATGGATRVGVVLPVATQAFRGRWGQAVGALLPAGFSVLPGTGVGAAGAGSNIIAVVASLLAGAAAGSARAGSSVAAATASIAVGGVAGNAEAGGGALSATSSLLAGMAAGAAGADSNIIEAALSLLAGAAAGDARSDGGVSAVTATSIEGVVSVSVDASGTLVELFRYTLAGNATGTASIVPLASPSRQSRSLIGGEATGIDTNLPGTGFDFDFDFDFDGTQDAGAQDGEAVGQTLVVQASIEPGVAVGRGFAGWWYPPIAVQAATAGGAVLTVRVILIPGRATATAVGTAVGKATLSSFELIPGAAKGQVVSLIAGRAVGDALAEGSVASLCITNKTDLHIMRDNEFLLTSDDVDPIVCDNDLLLAA